MAQTGNSWVQRMLDDLGVAVVAPSDAITDAVAISGGEAPTEAEHNALVTKINAILAALRAQGIIAS